MLCLLQDFPCPVLLRELMVWCWQQDPEDRPSADGIITATGSEQFPRLLDGIRACNAGQVCGCDVCMCTYVSPVEPQIFMVKNFCEALPFHKILLYDKKFLSRSL